ncbi:hypothetical protein F5X68DRAFT_198063 [Plectosphaerella plurivora]|uniref:Uncharacterized protein n=1 Tax=Plectosphaerella plurivora TaxID=936078 RepID=A0A9P9AH74_9PEZI|nr:hypothetical protein F5X68DRAFT_198063 [Plectosphaerella plurivora]
MDQLGFLAPPAPAPAAAAEQVPNLAGHIFSCILSCAASSDRINNNSCFMLPGVSANFRALEQIGGLLEENNLVPIIKQEGKESAEALASNLRRLCRGLAVLLLKAGTPPSDEADLSELTDYQMMQRLSPRHLASVVRGDRHKWLKPRVELYVEELMALTIDSLLQTHVFRLAQLQMSRANNASGSFEEELAVRAFAQRFLALRQKDWDKRQADHEKRYRLRKVSDRSETCSIVSSRCPSEAISRTSTVVERKGSTPPPPPGPPEPPVLKFEPPQPHVSTVPLGVPQTAKPTQQPQPASQHSETKTQKPGFFKRQLVNLRHRAWSTFSRDAAALRTLNYRGKPPKIEAWIMSEKSTCIFRRQESNEELLREIRRHVKSGTDSFWDAALSLTSHQQNVMEDTRIKAIMADRLNRRCIFVSNSNEDCQLNSDAQEHLNVYFLVGDEEADHILITEPYGREFQVPLGRRFWTCVATAYKLSGPMALFTKQAIIGGAYKLIAEDGSEFRSGSPWKLIRPGGKYRMVLDAFPTGIPPSLLVYPQAARAPPPPSSFQAWMARRPVQYRNGRPIPPSGPPHPPRPPPFRRPVRSNDDSDSDSDDDDDGKVTWEIVQELGFEDRKPVCTAKLSELLAAWTNAPDTEFDADISESVLGPMPDDDSDSTMSTTSGTTID